MAFRDVWRGEPRDPHNRYQDRWQNSYSGPGDGRYEARGNVGSEATRGDNRDDNYGGSDNPFLGDHPLTRAGSAYESDYFAGNGIPTTRDRPEVNEPDFRGEPASWSANQSATGQHRGRGPRGYQRSDERIKEDVSVPHRRSPYRRHRCRSRRARS